MYINWVLVLYGVFAWYLRFRFVLWHSLTRRNVGVNDIMSSRLPYINEKRVEPKSENRFYLQLNNIIDSVQMVLRLYGLTCYIAR